MQNETSYETALSVFKQSTQFDQWMPLCQNKWNSQIATADPLLEMLLDRCKLKGTIPNSIDLPDTLEILHLSHNELKENIPENIGNLTNLKQLFLDDNHFNGTIPDTIGSLHNLQKLWLSENYLEGGIPHSIGDLLNLEQLNLDANKLNGEIPENIGNLTNLKQLYLGGNNFNGTIPDTISSLHNLTDFWLINNDLEGYVPSGIIESMMASEMEFVHICDGNDKLCINPSDIDKIAEIPLTVEHDLDVCIKNCALSEFKQSTQFDQWEVMCKSAWESQIEAHPLLDLHLYSCNLSGRIPNSIDDAFSTLRKLGLGHNNLEMSIPEEIGLLNHLRELKLHDNNLEGNIPEAIGGLVHLEDLHLNKNKLTGEIPSTFENLHNLKTLYLVNNKITGTVPSFIIEMAANMEYVFICEGNDELCINPADIDKIAEIPSTVYHDLNYCIRDCTETPSSDTNNVAIWLMSTLIPLAVIIIIVVTLLTLLHLDIIEM